MVLGGVLIAFLVAVMPATLASGTPTTVETEPIADPSPRLGAADSREQDADPEDRTGVTRIVAASAVAAILVAGISFLLLRNRRRTPTR